MNARVSPSIEGAAVASEAQLLACDFVAEAASHLVAQSAALVAAASSGDVVATEARLWACRRTLTAAISSWREFVPPLEQGGAQ